MKTTQQKSVSTKKSPLKKKRKREVTNVERDTMVKKLIEIRDDKLLPVKIRQEKLNKKIQEYMQETSYTDRTIRNWMRPTRALKIELEAKKEQISSTIEQYHLSTTKEESHLIFPTTTLVHNDKCVGPVTIGERSMESMKLDNSLR